MIIKKIQKFSKIFLVEGLSILLFLNFWFAQSNYDENLWLNKTKYVDLMVKNLNDSISDIWLWDWKKWMLKVYCAAVFDGEDIEKWFVNQDQQNSFLYDPKQSLFMFYRCKDLWFSDKFSIIEWFLKKWNIDKIANIWSSCDLAWDMRNCEFDKFIRLSATTIFDDLYNLKLANSYWYDNGSLEDSVNSFTKTFFGEEICKDNVIYLANKKQSDPNLDQCYHPKTYDALRSWIKSAQKLVLNTSVVDYKKVVDFNLQKESCLVANSNLNLIWCSFKNNELSWVRFQNLLSNELMYITMFSRFASNVLANNLWVQEYSLSSNLSDKFQNAIDESLKLNQELSTLQQSVKQSSRVLAQIISTYPIHIGMLAYYEDLLEFRKRLVKISVPLHQLYYTLRNVQEKNQ